jgi:hypothetical protein
VITRKKRAQAAPELALAIGMIWGHLNARQFDDAYQLARGCAMLWPDDQRLSLMAAYAAVELAAPLEDDMVHAMKTADCIAWTSLIWRRAYSPGELESAADLE